MWNDFDQINFSCALAFIGKLYWCIKQTIIKQLYHQGSMPGYLLLVIFVMADINASFQNIK